MKKRRKFYHPDPWPQDGRGPELQGTFVGLVGILIIGIMAVAYLGV